ncbi:unnamed protein product [Didymodactylos carnosus]|uniref:Isochorismatase-like domain-containing protein n=1 Tax=Didymodactylos carnosus TaxID=1234261 RepID=A0A8S2W0B9_9BILA|nr:unnamed protein product [Didymodactylos carnosus]CAF4400337.1 unnamed protein product [Didymodactylos carnosus]
MLTDNRIQSLIICGVTTEVCVLATLHEANDRGYECLLVEDATASYFPKFKQITIEMLRSQGGLICWTIPSKELLEKTHHLSD